MLKNSIKQPELIEIYATLHYYIPMMITEMVEELLAEVEQAVAFAKRGLTKAPDGLLFTRKSQGTVRYYKRNSGDTCGQYLRKDCQETIRALQEKNYYSELLKTGKKEEQVLQNIRKELEAMPDYKAVFLNIPQEKRHLIAPYEKVSEGNEEWIRLFNKKYVPGEIRLVTQNGEHVRSKSELIIADRLKAAGVPYFYEDPLIMKEESTNEFLYWHPDFRVQNRRTGKVFYWEHFGMMDNPEYCKSCQEKLEIYAHYGYFPGENLIVTSESSQHGLNMEYVDCLVEKYLE